MRGSAWMAAVLAVVTAAPAAWARRPRDFFRRTVSLGATIGAGSPRGVAGAFLSVRPVRWMGAEVGAGLGGAFGPGVDATVLVSPVGTRRWALEVSGSLSRQWAWSALPSTPDGRTLPTTSDWVSLGVASAWRPSRGMMVRIGVGRAWLLDTGAWATLRTNELDYAAGSLEGLPGATPLDAARAAVAGERLGVWYVHLDMAPSWRW